MKLQKMIRVHFESRQSIDSYSNFSILVVNVLPVWLGLKIVRYILTIQCGFCTACE